MRKTIVVMLLTILLHACSKPSMPPENPVSHHTKDSAYIIKTGRAKMILVDDKFSVWTKKTGDGKIKVLLLHGGPGRHV